MGKDVKTGDKARVVVVDDHALVRAGLVELVRGQGDLEVCGEASDVSTALRLARECKPDLMIVDLTLRDGSGLDLVKRVIAQDSSIRILVCSMHDEMLFAERALAAGALGYVSKQEPSKIVLEALRRVLAGRIYTSQEIADRVLRRASGKSPETSGTPVDLLSDRELEVLGLLGEGLSTREIADRLNLSTKTIDTHREHIKTKLSLKNTNELVRFAVAWTLGPPGNDPTERRDDES